MVNLDSWFSKNSFVTLYLIEFYYCDLHAYHMCALYSCMVPPFLLMLLWYIYRKDHTVIQFRGLWSNSLYGCTISILAQRCFRLEHINNFIHIFRTWSPSNNLLTVTQIWTWHNSYVCHIFGKIALLQYKLNCLHNWPGTKANHS